MPFEKFFRLTSYIAVFCGFLALWVSGTFGPVATVLFLSAFTAGWFIEDSRFQISEKLGTALIVLAMPLFYLVYKMGWLAFDSGDAMIAGLLARVILALSAIKLLQKKGDRDWVFLYLMAFFEVLLGAGLSISPLYLATFLVYLLSTVCAVLGFEMRKAEREAFGRISRAPSHSAAVGHGEPTFKPTRRVPAAAVALLALIAAAAIPLFFALPRVGGAGLGGSQRTLGTSTGFSDSVRLGGIGRIQQNDEIVMRVKAEEGKTQELANSYFRGVALDRFDNRTWSKSRPVARETFVRGENGFIQLDQADSGIEPLLATVYLEPLDTNVIFAVPDALAIQANFSTVSRDSYGALSAPWGSERNNYRFLSDIRAPLIGRLRADDVPYLESYRNYLDTSVIEDDPRFAELTNSITRGHANRYDKARAVEQYLQTQFGYTLEQKASGDEPLADFLFNVREGHCEYFASAMALMLRTQGIATRVVNGFRGGEYNPAVDTLIVRQRFAHSWVEVYFPGEDEWTAFDPTPAASLALTSSGGGFAATLGRYLEALDTIWIQYFVAFDNQEQRSLVRSIRSDISDLRGTLSASLSVLQEAVVRWWNELRGVSGLSGSLIAIAYGLGLVVLLAAAFFLARYFGGKALSWGVWSRISGRSPAGVPYVDFYEKMSRLLAQRGIVRAQNETPLEFANASGIREVTRITEVYNRVRFGGVSLTIDQRSEVEGWLNTLEEK